MPATQTLLLGSLQAAVDRALGRVRTGRVLRRLWDKDPSLWPGGAASHAHIRERLGWLTISGHMIKQAAVLHRLAREVRDAGFTHALLLGMGGSSLFAEVCRETFGVTHGHVDVLVLDSTDPTAVRRAEARAPLKTQAIIVSSKSGSTSEVHALSTYFYHAIQKAGGQAGTHGIAITDAGTPLAAQARAWNFRHLFTHGPDSGMDVGGRFSALTYFGLVPAALLGLDTKRLLQRAIRMFDRCGPEVAPALAPGAQLGAVLAASAEAGRDKMTLLCSSVTGSLGTWVEQLVAESLGKSGKGIVPIFGEPAREPAGYGNDRLFVELQVNRAVDRDLERRVKALAAAGHPVVRIRWQDRYDLGGEIAKWAVAGAVAGHLMKVDPFDEPNVQESKDRTKALLRQYVKDGQFPQELPLSAEGPVTLYGAKARGALGTVRQTLEAFLALAAPQEYVALLSFLPRLPDADEALRVLRGRLSERLQRATLLGFGPRYLHSTGQLFKGGPDGGIFLLLTAEETKDLPIPGEPYSFGVLKQAQALGDYQAMQQKGRRVLRVRLGKDVLTGLRHLSTALLGDREPVPTRR